MTMSVGLARIINDPEAPLLTRKALGALSTPHLLCDDQGITIDDSGRFVVKLKADGGILQASDGLHLEITFGVDSHVDLDSDEHDREWNARITGTAPNYFAASVGIGTEDFGAESAAITALGSYVEKAKVCIESVQTQLRLRYDQSNFMSQRVQQSGFVEFYSVGNSATEEPGFIFISGDGTIDGTGFSGGVSINGGTTVEQIFGIKAIVNFAGGGVAAAISWEEHIFTISSPYSARDEQDHVTVCPLDGLDIPTEWISYTARINYLGQLCVRITWIGVTAAENRYWLFLVHKLKA